MKITKIDYGMVLIFGLFPVVTTTVSKGTAVLFLVCGLGAAYKAFRENKLAEVFSWKCVAFGLAAVSWMTISNLTAYEATSDFPKMLEVVGLVFLAVFVFWYVRDVESAIKGKIIQAVASGALVALVVILISYFVIHAYGPAFKIIERSDKLSVLSPGLIILSIIFIPTVLYFVKRKKFILGAVFTIGIFSVSFATSSLASILILLSASAAVIVFWRVPIVMARMLSVGLVLFTVLSPLTMPLLLDRIAVNLNERQMLADGFDPDGNSGSIVHRYSIWRFATDMSLQRPFQGWGFHMSRHLPGGDTLIGHGKELMPLHPHNMILQVWVELGIPGIVLLTILVWLLMRRRLPHTNKRLENLAWSGTGLSIFIAGNVSFGAWQSWWISSIVFCVAVAMAWTENQYQR